MSKLMELAAIWVENKIQVETEDNQIVLTKRIAPGNHIRVIQGTLLDVTKELPANYTVFKCMGTINSDHLEFHLIGNDFRDYRLIIKENGENI